MAVKEPKTVKAQVTRASLIVTAATILRTQGPAAVTYRNVATTAGVSNSSTLYYFDSLSELISEATHYNINKWVSRAELIAGETRNMTSAQVKEKYIDLLISACLPCKARVEYATHYAQLAQASASKDITQAYAQGRIRLNKAVQEILNNIGWDICADIIVAVVDGGAVVAISEDKSVMENIALLLSQLYESSHR